MISRKVNFDNKQTQDVCSIGVVAQSYMHSTFITMYALSSALVLALYYSIQLYLFELECNKRVVNSPTAQKTRNMKIGEGVVPERVIVHF